MSVQSDTVSQSSVPEDPHPVPKISYPEVLEFQEHLRNNQRFFSAIVAGLIAALLASSVWAAITWLTGFQIGWMAVGVGILVGVTVRIFGGGVDMRFGFLGAALALFGCIAGNTFTIAAAAADETLSMISALILLILNPALTLELLARTFSPIDLLFYGLAVYYGFKTSFQVLTNDEVRRLLRARAMEANVQGTPAVVGGSQAD